MDILQFISATLFYAASLNVTIFLYFMLICAFILISFSINSIFLRLIYFSSTSFAFIHDLSFFSGYLASCTIDISYLSSKF